MKLVQDDSPVATEEAPIVPILLDEPMHNYVLLQEVPLCEVSKGGVHVAPNATKFERRGRVLAVGPGLWNSKGERIPMSVKVGDIVSVEPGYWLVVDEYSTPRGLVAESKILGKCH